MKIQIIGCGKMGGAILEAILQTEIDPQNIHILEYYKPRQEELKTNYGVQIGTNPDAELLILAIKPQQLENIDFSIRKKETVLLSILAGTSLATLTEKSAFSNIIRCMPNLCLMVNKGLIAYIAQGEISQHILNFLEKSFSNAGYFFPVDSEDMIDKITAISGSGPAYFFYFTELLQQKAEAMGFDTMTAKRLAEQTFIGSAKTLESNNLTTKEWKDAVTSKGGTTQSALESFEKNKLENNISEAVDAAYGRAKKLSVIPA